MNLTDKQLDKIIEDIRAKSYYPKRVPLTLKQRFYSLLFAFCKGRLPQ